MPRTGKVLLFLLLIKGILSSERSPVDLNALTQSFQRLLFQIRPSSLKCVREKRKREKRRKEGKEEGSKKEGGRKEGKKRKGEGKKIRKGNFKKGKKR